MAKLLIEFPLVKVWMGTDRGLRRALVETLGGRFRRGWDVPGYVLRRLDRGRFVRSSAAWCRLLDETWSVSDVKMIRNFLIEYFTCTLTPPRPTESVRASPLQSRKS